MAKIQLKDGFIVVECEKNLVGQECGQLYQGIQNELKSCEAGVILDLKSVEAVDMGFYRMLAVLGKWLRSAEKKFFGVNASADIAKGIRDNGLDSSIKMVASFQAALGGEPKARPSIDVEFVNPFVDSTIKTLSTQCNLQILPGKPRLKGAEGEPPVAIAGVIGLTSKAFNGSIALCFPEKTFLGAMEGMLGEPFPELTKDLEDGAGELLNIIFGQAKIVLNEKGMGIEKAIPTIVTGQSIAVRHLVNRPTIVLPFETEKGPFFIEVGIDEVTNQK
jgi:chemotaxis protein CheX